MSTARPWRSAIVAVGLTSVLAAPAGAQRSPHVIQYREFRTVPATPGLRLDFSGAQRVVTDRRGEAVVLLPAWDDVAVGRQYRYLQEGGRWVRRPVVRPRRLRDGGVARLDGFIGFTIAVARHYRFRPDFRDPGGRPIDQRLIDGYRLKSRTGQVLDVEGTRSVTLQATRVVQHAGRLVSKDIDWSVEAVKVAGSNVVQRAAYRFSPRRLRNRPYRVRLLFFPLRVTSSDALFGFHVGRDVTLRYPNGRTVRLSFRDGQVFLPAVPRGTYTVKVNAPGLSPARPVAVSRPQDVRLEVISWLDLLLVGVSVGGFALLLLVARRPNLRRLPW
jgi:hypothetical protein